MKMKSMTGFGFAEAAAQDCRVEVSVKSVNSRFTDVKFYTSPVYFPMEKELKALILNSARRGQWTVRLDRFPPKPPALFVISRDKKQALRWRAMYNKLAQELKVKNDMGVSHLARLEGVIQVIEKTPPLDPAEKTKVRVLFKKALRSCLQEKSREGMVLKKDMAKCVNSLQKSLEKIQKLYEKESKKSSDRLKPVLKERRGAAPAETEDLIQFLERRLKNQPAPRRGKESSSAIRRAFASYGPLDISEEIVRLKAHLKNCNHLLQQKGPVGKKLDFYTQEVLRELNTIGSKSQAASITHQVVEGKTTLEKIKEQAQNIE